jgi:hypothetical protein
MTRIWTGVCACVLTASAQGAVGPEVAKRLGGDLTPVGASAAGNPEGTIPAWDGGLHLSKAADAPYADPYTQDQPRLVIDAAHLEDYQGRLSPGQQAWLRRYADTARMPVYATRRSVAAPDAYYAGTAQNAVRVFLDPDSGLPQKAVPGAPFPIPSSGPDGGEEVIWNHVLRWRGPGRERASVIAVVSPSGSIQLAHLRERAKFHTLQAGYEQEDRVPLYDLAITVLDPPRLAGTFKLAQVGLKGISRARQKSPDLVRSLSSTDVGGDTPAIGAEGAVNEDQMEGYSGSPERYRWKLLGKREMFVPYNAYRLHAASLTELLGAHHVDPASTRYELHRVWALDARCKPNQACSYPQRTFYLDEDSWQILLVDLYDRSGQLAMLQEVHTFMAYDHNILLPAYETCYDLQGGRYAFSGLDQSQAEVRFPDLPDDAFGRNTVARWARRHGPPYEP